MISQILKEVLGANSQYVAGFGDKGKLPLPPALRQAMGVARAG
jgi:carbonic anhydrase